MRSWCACDALMVHWWCSNDALMIDDALMMCSWCTDNALMMCWWWPDDALIMHWWCTDDALSVKHKGQASDLHWRFYGGRINGLSDEQSFSHILVPCHLDWVKSAHSIARRTAGQAYQWPGLICPPPLPLPPVLQCQVGLRWMKHCKLCGIGLDLWARKSIQLLFRVQIMFLDLCHICESVWERGGWYRDKVLSPKQLISRRVTCPFPGDSLLEDLS